MSKKIIGITVGTPIKPQKIIDKIDLSNYYTKEEIDQIFEIYGNEINWAFSNYYTKEETETLITNAITSALNTEV